MQLNNLELAVNLAKRGNLPGAENLVHRFYHSYWWRKFFSQLFRVKTESSLCCLLMWKVICCFLLITFIAYWWVGTYPPAIWEYIRLSSVSKNYLLKPSIRKLLSLLQNLHKGSSALLILWPNFRHVFYVPAKFLYYSWISFSLVVRPIRVSLIVPFLVDEFALGGRKKSLVVRSMLLNIWVACHFGFPHDFDVPAPTFEGLVVNKKFKARWSCVFLSILLDRWLFGWIACKDLWGHIWWRWILME